MTVFVSKSTCFKFSYLNLNLPYVVRSVNSFWVSRTIFPHLYYITIHNNIRAALEKNGKKNLF